MKIRYPLWPAALCLSMMGSHPAIAKTAPTASAERALDLFGALRASAPHASLADQAPVFERLVGSWDVQYMDIKKDGRQVRRSGLFTVAWVLDGRAIEDVWIVDPSDGRSEREVYADLRYFDPKTRSWPAVFIDPEHASMATFTGGATADGRIVLQTSDLGRPQTRWSWIDIRQDSLVFRDEYSSDGGVSWTLQAEYHMTRHHDAVSR